MFGRLMCICILLNIQWIACEASCEPTYAEHGCYMCWKDEYKNSLENLNYIPSNRMIYPDSLHHRQQLGLVETEHSDYFDIIENREKRSSDSSDGSAAETEDAKEMCKDSEQSHGRSCYFLTPHPVQGFRAYLECQLRNASLAAIERDEQSQTVRKLVNSSADLYVYISYEKDNLYGTSMFNMKEEAFKYSVCSWVGCECTAFRVTTGSFHSRICDTQHRALCLRRPAREAATTTARPGATPTPAGTTEQAERSTPAAPDEPPDHGHSGETPLRAGSRLVAWGVAALLLARP